jgi:hypothetical protein
MSTVAPQHARRGRLWKIPPMQMGTSLIAGLVFGFAMLFSLVSAQAADPAADTPKVRKCSAWCVSSYRGAVAESISCIDSCQRGHAKHPVAFCAKICVGDHPRDVPGIVDCIDRCGTTAGRGGGKRN